MKIVALFLSLASLTGCSTINVQSGSDASSSSGEDPSSSSTSNSASSSSGSGGQGTGGNEGGSTSSSSTSSTSSSGGSTSGSGGSGGGVCNTCDQMLHGGCEALPMSSDNSCPGASDSYTALFQCGMTHCKEPCSTDGTSGYLYPCSTIANNFCDNCLQNNCGAQFNACL